MNAVIIVGLIIFSNGKWFVVGKNHEGDNCVVEQTNTRGICTFLSKCPTRIADTPCGFQDNEMIVCCPQISALNTRQSGKISDAMCKSYSQYIWTVELSPTLLVGAEDIVKMDCPFNRQQLVVGGDPASRREFPHMVQIGYEGDAKSPIKWSCGGSLISDQFVLTAAHCLEDRSLGFALFARMGLIDVDDPTHVQEFNLTERIPHPKYQDSSHYHDIGLVKLHKRAELNSWVRPACLYTKRNSPLTNAIATGWGKTDSEDESTVLRRVVLELYDQVSCSEVYKQQTGTVGLLNGIQDELMICAGHSMELRDTCQGDSGGPLQIYRAGDKNVSCMYDVIGVTMFGKGCGLAVNLPGVYTRVSTYLKWIEDHVWPLQ